MVCAESLCCGTPVVGFKSGGPELIALPGFSKFVDQGNDDDLEKALNEMLDRDIDKECISEKAVDIYDRETMCKNYYEVYRNILM